MRYILMVLLVFLQHTVSWSQVTEFELTEAGYDKYLPFNPVVKKNKIHYIVDSSEFFGPGPVRTLIYDTLGRMIGDIYNPIDSFDNPYVYKQTGDTTYRLQYNTRGELYSLECFVVNKIGAPVSYLECRNYYFKDDSYSVNYKEFYYDEKNRLRSLLSYYKEAYPGKVSDQVRIKPVELDINDVVYFSYGAFKNGNKLMIGRHAAGPPLWRPTDSTFYDAHNRIVRSSSFARLGVIGEWVFDDLNRITDYVYHKDTLEAISYETYCFPNSPTYGCLNVLASDADKTRILYNKNGTKRLGYSIYHSGEIQLTDKYTYYYYRR